MSEYRKRRASDSLEGDRKRYSFERYDCDSYIKHEYNPHVRCNNGRQNYVAVPSYSVAPVAPIVQSAIVCNKPQRYYYSQTVEPIQSDKANVILSIRNYSSSNDAIPIYDNRSRMHYEYEVYINSLRQSEPRYVNFNNLRRHLSDIDIRCLYNWNFATALDLTQELESSLKYFVDTRNELVFLRKLQHHQCIPFSYNEINISNRSGLLNRMTFLENESSYRSTRMNQLFHQLQSVVIPSIIDDIRYVHSVSYQRSWTNRARYWFSKFKQIKWLKRSGIVSNRARNYHHRSYQSDHRHYNVKDEFEVTNTVNVKSELVVKPKVSSLGKNTVKRENILKVQSKDTRFREQVTNMQPEKTVQIMSTIVEKTIESDDSNNALVLEKIVAAEHQQIAVESQDKVDVGADKECESDNLSSSFVIIEPNISVVTVPDDDNNDASSNANPPEGDNKN